MRPIQIVGVVGVAVGAVLLGFAHYASNAPVDKLSDSLTGRFTDRTIWYFVLGVAAAIGGTILALLDKRS